MKREVGVAIAVKESDLLAMTALERDAFGVDTVRHLQGLLKDYVGGAQPLPGSDLKVGITPPVDDPLQGRIVTVSVAMRFNTDNLPVGCGAYLQYVVNEPA